MSLAQWAVELCPYDRRWPALFIEERSRAVPGIEAKPILNMIASVSKMPVAAEILAILEELGYEGFGDLADAP